jgi:hypothetical protein
MKCLRSHPSKFVSFKLRNPSLHLSQRLPWTFFLQKHWPTGKDESESILQNSLFDPLKLQSQAKKFII